MCQKAGYGVDWLKLHKLWAVERQSLLNRPIGQMKMKSTGSHLLTSMG